MTDKCEKHNSTKICLSCFTEAFEANRDDDIARHVLFPYPHLRLNYQALARKIMPIEQLPPGALPIYDRDVDVAAVVLGENKCKAESGAWGQIQCALDEDHEGAHQNDDGCFKWYNENRPDDDQGWMCSEVKSD